MKRHPQRRRVPIYLIDGPHSGLSGDSLARYVADYGRHWPAANDNWPSFA